MSIDTTDDFSNGTDTTGRLLVDGVAVAGCIEQPLDSDWFAMEIVEGQIYRIDLTGITRSLTNLTVRDAAGNILFRSSADEAGDEDFLIFQASYSGTVFVDVQGSSFRGSSFGTGDYLLSASTLDADDFGNTIAEASALTVGAAQAGDISYFDDVDVLALNIVAGQDYNLFFTGTDAERDVFVITIYDEAGNVYDRLTSAVFSQNYTAEYTGLAFIEIRTSSEISLAQFQNDNDDEIGGYELSVTEGNTGFNFTDGSTRSDQIAGSFNSEDIYGGDGSDSILGSSGDDYIDGAEGNDRLFYTRSDQGVVIYADGRSRDSVTDADIIVNIENLTTTQFADRIIVGGELNNVSGGDGDDTIIATNATQNVFLSGGAGNDTLHGGNFDDSLNGGMGDDALSGGVGNDRIFGHEGDDLIFGNSGQDELFGNRGNDRMFGGTGNDEIDGGEGGDFIQGGYGDDVIIGGFGSDILRGGVGDDIINGDDEAFVSAIFSDRLYGDAGDDRLNGNQGDDFLYGGVPP